MEGLNKKCSVCSLIKNLNEFNLDKRAKDGRTSNCKVCSNNKNKEYREKNKDKEKLRKKEWNSKNKEKISEYNKNYKKINKEKIKENNDSYYSLNKNKINIKSKNYRELNKEKIKVINRNYKNKRLKNDNLFKLRHNIGNLIRNSFRCKFNKNSKTIEILGCTYEEFKEHLESLWQHWMNWDNYGLYNGEPNYGWDIDHIIPQSSVNTEEELIKLNHYTNLQPLCSFINRNIKKSNG